MTRKKTKKRTNKAQPASHIPIERLPPEARARLFQMEYLALRNKYGIEYAADLQYQRMGVQLQTVPVMVLQPVPDWQPPNNGASEPDED